MKLNISIPTYNRANFLTRAIESIAGQISGVDVGIEFDVCIYDNASTDYTNQVCLELCAKYDFIKFIRHDSNIGADANILYALQNSRSDYVWIFGDDDYLLDGTLSAICQCLVNTRCSLLKLESLEERDIGINNKESSNIDSITRPIFHRKNSKLAEFSPVNFSSANEVLARFGLRLGNFSTLIISNRFFDKYYTTGSPELFDAGYSQLAWIYKGVMESPSCISYEESSVVGIRIEMRPRGLSLELMNQGMVNLKRWLLKEGYSAAIVDDFISLQMDAVFLANLKERKLTGKKISLFKQEGVFSIRKVTLVKAIAISLLPSGLYFMLWKLKGLKGN